MECSDLREQLHQSQASATSLQAQHMHDTKALHTMATAVQHTHHSLQHAHRQGEVTSPHIYTQDPPPSTHLTFPPNALSSLCVCVL